MTFRNRKSLIGTFALAAMLAAPLAMAQQAEQQGDASAAAEQSASAAQQADTGAAAPQKKSWSDVDTDKNGSLSKSEVTSVPALGQVFDQADTNADGALTAEEYKAYVAKAQTGGKAKAGSGGQR